LKETFEKAINKSEYIYDKKEYWEKVENMLNAAERTRTGFLTSIIDTTSSKRNRMFYVVMIRNNPFPQVVDDVLNIIDNNKEDVKLRIALAEGLGWYVRSERKGEIIETFDSILKNEKNIDPKLADELTKTINRLKEYMR